MVWSHLKKKLIISLRASPAQQGQETAPERRGRRRRRRRRRRGKKGNTTQRENRERTPPSKTQHTTSFPFPLGVYSTVHYLYIVPPLYDMTHQTSLDTPPQAWIHHSWLLNQDSVCAFVQKHLRILNLHANIYVFVLSAASTIDLKRAETPTTCLQGLYHLPHIWVNLSKSKIWI